MIGAVFAILRKDQIDGALVIRDMWPGKLCMTVTNDAENVVRRVIDDCKLKPGMRLLYYDSEGRLDEIVVVNGRFAGFAPYTGQPKRSDGR